MSDAGRKVISVAALISTYGYLAASFVSAPRLPYALAVEGDCPPILATLHPRSDTPVYAIVGFAIVGCALAISGTFLWALALSAGSMTVVYTGICAALIRLRRKRPAADALRIPFATIVAIVGLALCAVLLTQLGVRHALLMLLTASLAAANGLWATHQTRHGRWRASVQL